MGRYKEEHGYQEDKPDDENDVYGEPEYVIAPVHVPRKRGRKKGSKNRPKTVDENGNNIEGNKITNFDPEYLLDRYYPLRKSVFNKFYSRFPKPEQQEELSSQIDLEFLQLIQEYDVSRGVDFPYYIGRMLNFRMWHFIEKNDKLSQREVLFEELQSNEWDKDEMPAYSAMDNQPDPDSDRTFEVIDAMNSIEADVFDNQLHAILIKGILAEGKPIEIIAEELGMFVSELNREFSALCDNLQQRAEKRKVKENPTPIERKSIRMYRVPIMSDEAWENVDWDDPMWDEDHE